MSVSLSSHLYNHRLQGDRIKQFVTRNFTTDAAEELVRQHKRLLHEAPYIYHFSSNLEKNRFKNVPMIDATRVRLPTVKESETDYVNASLVEGGELGQSIVCQSPQRHTQPEFWRMVWSEDVRLIVCLTQIADDDGWQYWPEKSKHIKIKRGSLHSFKIICHDVQQQRTHSHIYYLTIKHKDGEQREITLIHFDGWPRNALPKVDRIYDLLQVIWPLELETHDSKRPHPVVFQCGSGVGRSATLAVISLCCRQLVLYEKFDAQEQSWFVRKRRWGSMNSSQHYALVYLSVFNFAAIHEMLSSEDYQQIERTFRHWLSFAQTPPQSNN